MIKGFARYTLSHRIAKVIIKSCKRYVGFSQLCAKINCKHVHCLWEFPLLFILKLCDCTIRWLMWLLKYTGPVLSGWENFTWLLGMDSSTSPAVFV